MLTRIFEKLFPITEDNKQVKIAAATLLLRAASVVGIPLISRYTDFTKFGIL